VQAAGPENIMDFENAASTNGGPSERGGVSCLHTGSMKHDLSRSIRLAIVDDHHSVTERAAAQLARSFHVSQIIHARHVSEVLPDRDGFDVVVLDLRLEDGTDAASNVRSLQDRGWPTLLYTQAGIDEIAQTVAAGACGVIGKGDGEDALDDGVRSILHGAPHLNDTWAQAVQALESGAVSGRGGDGVLQLYAAGLSADDIGTMLGIERDAVVAALRAIRCRYPYAELCERIHGTPQGAQRSASQDR